MLTLFVTAISILHSPLLNASPVSSYGQWGSYFPTGKIFARQLQNNGASAGYVASKQEPGVGRYDLYHSSSSNVCNSGTNVEQFEVKYCSMKNMSNGSISYAQFVVFNATKNATSSATYRITVPTINGEKTAQFYWDNNGNNVIDSSDTGFIVSCPGDGHPYAIWNIDSIPNIMRVWFKQDISGTGSNYSRRMFWQSLVRPPVSKFNANWGTNGGSALSIIQSEAFWCADDNGSGCPIGGEWQVGAGSVGYLSDGKQWPTGANVAYGRNIWHAKDLAPFWWEDQWATPRISNGIDYVSTFSGCN